MHAEVLGPFGVARHVLRLATAHIAELYKIKCGVDITANFHGLEYIDLFRCELTGYAFWRPEAVAGDEAFYRLLSAAWQEYYRDWRWEYAHVLPLIKEDGSLLEVGCGRGYFLKIAETRAASLLGLELNNEAIRTKVTSAEIRALTVEQLARAQAEQFDLVCSFQVLEHVTEPASFITSCLECLKLGGLLAFSTPNFDYVPHQKRQDAFDMPPHHMGYFSPSVYQRLAKFYGIRLERIYVQRRFFAPESVTDRTRSNLFFRLLTKLASKALNGAYWITDEPGSNLLALFRKMPGP